ncbi:hypothetical protein BC827DRAFT_1347593 [Russula dissimulans]|nr:hypothetical protein BC827DRAFT_1347593 [Russula dissimulans]
MKRTITALPQTDSPQVQQMANQDPNYLSAYNVCLRCEEQFAANENKIRYIRILGYLLLHAPDRVVRSEVTRCIHSCQSDDDLATLGSFFELYFILPFRKFKSRTPGPSSHPSRPSFETVKDEMKVDIREAPKNHCDAKIRALMRDNWRCVVTGILDMNAPDDITAELDLTQESGQFTECAHILPESTFFGVKPKSDNNLKLDYSASVLAVLHRFNSDIRGFNGEKVHSLINVITLDHSIHDPFDRLGLYFEAMPQENRYEVRSLYRLKLHPHMRQFVTFSTTDAEHLPVPSRELLALHATCCTVAHFSGAAEYIDRTYLDEEETGVLASDGTSGDMLTYALLSLSNDVVSVQG